MEYNAKVYASLSGQCVGNVYGLPHENRYIDQPDPDYSSPRITGWKSLSPHWLQIEPQVINEICAVTPPGMINYFTAKSDLVSSTFDNVTTKAIRIIGETDNMKHRYNKEIYNFTSIEESSLYESIPSLQKRSIKL